MIKVWALFAVCLGSSLLDLLHGASALAKEAEFTACVAIAQGISPPLAQTYLSGSLFLSEQDVALTGCFLKFASLEDLDERGCYDLASKLPTPFSVAVARQSCFENWFDQGTFENCSRIADLDEPWRKYPSGEIRFSGESYDLQVPEPFQSQSEDQTYSLPKTLQGKSALKARCDAFKRDTLMKRLDRLSGESFLIDRIVPERPLTEAELKVCSLEASLLATDYEILRARRIGVAAPLLTQLRTLLKAVPSKVRDAISLGRSDHTQLLLEGYAQRALATHSLKVDPTLGRVSFNYRTTKDGVIRGSIRIHASLEEDEREIESKVIEPIPGGWKKYFKREATQGCPVVPKSFVSSTGVSGNNSKVTPEAFEKRLGSCDPLKGDCGARVAQ